MNLNRLCDAPGSLLGQIVETNTTAENWLIISGDFLISGIYIEDRGGLARGLIYYWRRYGTLRVPCRSAFGR